MWENLTSACCRTGFPLCSKPAAKNVLSSVQRRVSQAKNNDPNIRPMKDKINVLAEQIKSASSDQAANPIKQQDKAVLALINYANEK